MNRLRELQLATSYHKGTNDIAHDFYLPCMRASIRYDRAVGFFNSTIYTIAWAALKDFVERQGMMRIICSPILSSEDAKALTEGYSAQYELLTANRLRMEIEHLLNTPSLEQPARVLATLVALGNIDFRIAFVGGDDYESQRRLFHDKVGIFSDLSDDSVVFKGSMNETWSGLANDGNLESVDVFLSWAGQRELNRITDEKTYFSMLWNNQYPGVVVKSFPHAAHEILLSAASPENWKYLVDEITRKVDSVNEFRLRNKMSSRSPRPHQVQALTEWARNNRRGIFEHSTGSGKTFTALCAIRESLKKNEVSLVLVPSDLLLGQWLKEIRDTLSDLDPRILVCGGGHSEWRNNHLLSSWTRVKSSDKPRIVLSTLQTATSNEFHSQLQQGEHLFVVVDEVHRIGSPKNRTLLNFMTGPRLGLSATPHRAGDLDGTKALLEYFHGIIPPPFTLKDAIPSVLTPYFYYVHTIRLTNEEQERWMVLSKRISSSIAQQYKANNSDSLFSTRTQLLLIERARIAKAAENKTSEATEILYKEYKAGQRWIVYCDSLQQLQTLSHSLRVRELPAVEYYSEMIADKKQTIQIFESNGGILVSIRCLDEGVDIPSVDHALILASSRNPREFIQRRGRVLRKAPGKYVAYIHDVLVLPTPQPEDDVSVNIIKSELARAIEFGLWAENPSSITDLQLIANEFGMDYQAIADGGYEDDDE